MFVEPVIDVRSINLHSEPDLANSEVKFDEFRFYFNCNEILIILETNNDRALIFSSDISIRKLNRETDDDKSNAWER